MHSTCRTALAVTLVALGGGAAAADWSDTSISYRTGTKYAEPFGSTSIRKHIVSLTHASGYKYGTNFFNVDLLKSDSKDPASAGSSEGAQEVYLVYRHTLDLGKLTGAPMAFGPVRGFGVTAGFDANAKTDAGYNSKKRMAVLGPTVMFDVPGFLNVSLLALWESNSPYSTFTHTGVPRYSYRVHPMVTAAWGIGIGKDSGLSFEGFANWIASKGRNEFGGATAAETNIDMQLMYDVGAVTGLGKNTLKVGIEYQYWRNKFGNRTTAAGAGAGPGATAKTPQLRIAYHF